MSNKQNIYWISKGGLKNLPTNFNNINKIQIWNNTANAKQNKSNWIVADKTSYAPFKQQNKDDDADFVFIIDNNTAYFYTWDKGKPMAAYLGLVASFNTNNANITGPNQWYIMGNNDVTNLLAQYYGNNQLQSWIKIQLDNPSEFARNFINSAISYTNTNNILMTTIINQNTTKINQNTTKNVVQIVPQSGFGSLIEDNNGKFRINGKSYKFNSSTGNGDLGDLIEHINTETNGYGKYFHANLSFENDCIKYNFYINPMLHTIQFKAELENSHNIILNGAPGTGKTYLAHEIAAVMLGKNTWKEVENDANLSSHVGFVQFHPSYDYTDFVEGLRPTTQGKQPFELLPGIFKTFCEEALKKGYKNDGKGKYDKNEDGNLVAKEDQLPYIFIIDEINRGEMSKIFGELFFSIDPGYRGKKGKVQTQYANMEKNGNEFDKALSNGKTGQFFVPKNVYIIGTMNDIDRSVESMDFAMRRRFKFVEILTSKQDGMLKKKFGNDADEVIRRMNNLNLAIQETEGLGSEYHIGPSYFLKLENQDFDKLWKDYLKGIIYEYLRGRDDVSDTLGSIQKAYNESTELYTINPDGELSKNNQ